MKESWDGVMVEEKPVALIASGYEWVCPDCDHYNREIEALLIVQCQECKRKYEVDETLHAYG